MKSSDIDSYAEQIVKNRASFAKLRGGLPERRAARLRTILIKIARYPARPSAQYSIAHGSRGG
jgi:hypothetical protein